MQSYELLCGTNPVLMVMDPLSGHQAIGTATRPWTRPLVVDPPLGNQAIGTATNCGSNL